MNTTVKNEDSLRGLGFALTAYVLWGFLPIFMKALAHISPAEVIAHRVIWSLPIAGVVLWATGRTGDLMVALRTPKMLLMGAATAALITINWGIYVWAIGAGHALDAALGYYINPLFSVFLGAMLLGEKLSLSQKWAIALAAFLGPSLSNAMIAIGVTAASAPPALEIGDRLRTSSSEVGSSLSGALEVSVQIRQWGIFTGNRVFLVGPMTKINQATAF